jgi:hypothetical protein
MSLLDNVKKSIVECVIKVEREYLGAPGSVKREAVIDLVIGLVDIPYIPAMIETPIKRAFVGWLIDMAVDKLNWITGYSFADVEITPEAVTKFAPMIEEPVTVVAKSAVMAKPDTSVDDRI